MLSRGTLFISTLTFGCTLALQAALPLGRPLADIPMEGPGNTTVNAREYLGKSVVFAIISTSCKDCIAAAEILTRLQKEFGPRGVQVIGAIADDRPKVTVPSFVARHKINFPVGFVNPDSIRRLAALPEGLRPYVPLIMFVDAKGMVRRQYYGNDLVMVRAKMEGTIRDTLGQLLDDRPAPTKRRK